MINTILVVSIIIVFIHGVLHCHSWVDDNDLYKDD
jgi:hypothetical protein